MKLRIQGGGGTNLPRIDAAAMFRPKNTPEHALIFAILERAVLDLKDTDSEIRASARRWIYRRDASPFSMSWCVSELLSNHEEQTIDYAIKRVRSRGNDILNTISDIKDMDDYRTRRRYMHNSNPYNLFSLNYDEQKKERQAVVRMVA